MTTEQLVMWYFIIGLAYSLINGIIRKIDTDGDYLLPFVWLTLWPLGIISLIIFVSIEKYKKLSNKL